MTPGRNPSSRTSADATSRNSSPRPCAFFRSSASTLARPPVDTVDAKPSIPPGRSTLITSAPMPASSEAANGPGPMPAISTTTMPASGPLIRRERSGMGDPGGAARCPRSSEVHRGPRPRWLAEVHRLKCTAPAYGDAMTRQIQVCVLGAGSWGTTVASLVAANAHVTLWARRAEQAAEIDETHVNGTYLPGMQLHPALRATGSIEDAVWPADVLV